jgi:4-amino-4-deoxy-L-arabinose transferase-like glycosyltransferase
LNGQRAALAVILFAAGIRLVTFILSANYGADSITRSLLSQNWAHAPFMIWHPNQATSVWLPLPFYINGLALMIWDNVILVPRLISFVCALAALPVFFFLSRRLFGSEKAWIATACFSLFSLHIKYGNIAGSESIYVLLMLTVIYACLFYLDRPSVGSWLLLSLALLGAAMTRIEAWILIAYIPVVVIFRRWRIDGCFRAGKLLGAVSTACLATLFVVAWMYGSQQHYGDILYSLRAATAEHQSLFSGNVGSLGTVGVMLYNLLFWPAVACLSLSPLVMLAGLWGAGRGLKHNRGREWIILGLFMTAMLIYQSVIAGNLSPLARYFILPAAIICLFSGEGIISVARYRRFVSRPLGIVGLVLITQVIWTLGLSFNYRDSGHAYIRKLASVSTVTRYPGNLEPVISWLAESLPAGAVVAFSAPGFDSNPITFYGGVPGEQVLAHFEGNPEGSIERIAAERPDFLIIHRSGPIQQYFKLTSLTEKLTLGTVDYQHDCTLGDYGVYRRGPEAQPEPGFSQ